jgi:hypothetical protein
LVFNILDVSTPLQLVIVLNMLIPIRVSVSLAKQALAWLLINLTKKFAFQQVN